MVPKTAEEIAQDHAAEQAKLAEVRWNPALGWGLGAGVACGVAVYFIALSLLPYAYKYIVVIK